MIATCVDCAHINLGVAGDVGSIKYVCMYIHTYQRTNRNDLKKPGARPQMHEQKRVATPTVV